MPLETCLVRLRVGGKAPAAFGPPAQGLRLTSTGRQARLECPSADDPLPSYEPECLANKPRHQLFFAASDPPAGPYRLDADPPTYLNPPADELDCHLWRAVGRDGTCPAAATCLYRSHILARSDVPLVSGAARPLRVVESNRAVSPNLFLIVANHSGPGVRGHGPLRDETRSFVARLPPTVVEAKVRRPFFALGATLLRRAVRRTVRGGQARLRSDLLVAAVDLPGVRDLLAMGAAERVDLAERRAATAKGGEIRYCLHVDLRPATGGVARRWLALLTGGRASRVAGLDVWLRDRVRGRLPSPGTGDAWVWDEPFVSSAESRAGGPDYFAVVEPRQPFFAAGQPRLYGVEHAVAATWSDLARTATAAMEPWLIKVRGWLGSLAPSAAAARALGRDLDELLTGVAGPVDDWLRRGRRANRSFPREAVWDEFARRTIAYLPGWYLVPPDEHPFRGPLLRWWLDATPQPVPPGVAADRAALARTLSGAAIDAPVVCASSRLTDRLPVRFILGRSSLGRDRGGTLPPAPPRHWHDLFADPALGGEECRTS